MLFLIYNLPLFMLFLMYNFILDYYVKYCLWFLLVTEIVTFEMVHSRHIDTVQVEELGLTLIPLN